jgi:hypothetical protein
VARPLTLGSLARIIGSHVNGLRTDIGLPPVRSMSDVFLAASLVLVYTAEPFEYPRSDWPRKVRLVGPGLWEPPAEPPAWLEDIDRPLVLVTCSTMFQNDRRLAEVACEAFAGAPLDVVVTTGDVDPSGLSAPANVRIERYVPHSPVLRRAACAVCHAGMGITQKALAHGVPFRSGVISRRSLAASRWHGRACGCRHDASRPRVCERPYATPWSFGRARNESLPPSPEPAAPLRRPTPSRSS